jgi:hypothetical protein
MIVIDNELIYSVQKRKMLVIDKRKLISYYL